MSFPCYQVFLELADVLPQSFLIGGRYERVNEEETAFDGLQFIAIVIQRIVDVALEVLNLQQMGLILHAGTVPYRQLTTLYGFAVALLIELLVGLDEVQHM